MCCMSNIPCCMCCMSNIQCCTYNPTAVVTSLTPRARGRLAPRKGVDAMSHDGKEKRNPSAKDTETVTVQHRAPWSQGWEGRQDALDRAYSECALCSRRGCTMGVPGAWGYQGCAQEIGIPWAYLGRGAARGSWAPRRGPGRTARRCPCALTRSPCARPRTCSRTAGTPPSGGAGSNCPSGSHCAAPCPPPMPPCGTCLGSREGSGEGRSSRKASACITPWAQWAMSGEETGNETKPLGVRTQRHCPPLMPPCRACLESREGSPEGRSSGKASACILEWATKAGGAKKKLLGQTTQRRCPPLTEPSTACVQSPGDSPEGSSPKVRHRHT